MGDGPKNPTSLPVRTWLVVLSAPIESLREGSPVSVSSSKATRSWSRSSPLMKGHDILSM